MNWLTINVNPPTTGGDILFRRMSPIGGWIYSAVYTEHDGTNDAELLEHIASDYDQWLRL